MKSWCINIDDLFLSFSSSIPSSSAEASLHSHLIISIRSWFLYRCFVLFEITIFDLFIFHSLTVDTDNLSSLDQCCYGPWPWYSILAIGRTLAWCFGFGHDPDPHIAHIAYRSGQGHDHGGVLPVFRFVAWGPSGLFSRCWHLGFPGGNPFYHTEV